MNRCPTCGEHLNPGEMCGVCLFSRVLDRKEELPESIGQYRILKLIATGGMGTVYEAEQDQPRRTVALKVMRGGFFSAELLRRFERESQALARLQHSGIAQVYEVGAADDGHGPRPFFAMELIHGKPLDEYAEDRHLNTRQRLELMIHVCHAVQHAHERGIIHRDLKPGNILVDENGQPKILDFGVARIAHSGDDSDATVTCQTSLGQIVGTPAYMSPEQVRGDPTEIDTRSDVYALGVLLYQLLAGKMPYEITGNWHEAARVIREQYPLSLSSVNRTYRGDVETIAGKALEKDRSRRYVSAAELAADLSRYLEHQPIAARPASVAYQLGKFARRHKTPVAGVAGVFLALIGGVVASTAEANHARVAERSAIAEQAAANRERDRAVAAERRAEMARAQAEKSETKAEAAAREARQQRDHALRQQQRADFERASAKAVSDFLQQDLLSQASAIEQARPNVKADPDLKVRTALDRAAARIDKKFADQPLVEASIRLTIGNTYKNLGLFDKAKPHLQRALELRLRYSPEDISTAETLMYLGSIAMFEGKFAEAEKQMSRAIGILRRTVGDDDRHTQACLNQLSKVYLATGDYAKSERITVEVMETQRRLRGEEHPGTVGAMLELGRLYVAESKLRKAAELLTRAVDIYRRQLGPENPWTLASITSLASAYLQDGQSERAEKMYRELCEASSRVLGPQHPQTLTAMDGLARAYSAERNYDQAEKMFGRVIELANRVHGAQNPTTLSFVEHQAKLYWREGKTVQAEEAMVDLIECRKRVLGANHPDTIKVLPELAAVRIDLKKYVEAESVVRESMKAHEKLPADAVVRLNDQILLGKCLAGQGKFAEAEPLLLAGYEGLKKQGGDAEHANRSYLSIAGPWIVEFYHDWGKPDVAAEWTRKLESSKIASAAR